MDPGNGNVNSNVQSEVLYSSVNISNDIVSSNNALSNENTVTNDNDSSSGPQVAKSGGP